MLQLQIEPHFLFNTLGSAQQLAEKGAPAAARLIADLIVFLRASTPSMRGESSTLRQEAALVDAYLAIMKTRLGKRLAYAIDVPAALEARTVPPGMVITLVENALKHGIEPCSAGGRVTVAAALDGDDRLTVSVADTGVGLEECPGQGSDCRTSAAPSLLYGERAHLTLGEQAARPRRPYRPAVPMDDVGRRRVCRHESPDRPHRRGRAADARAAQKGV
jgi:LytS/YehU family sensor histidine kinase